MRYAILNSDNSVKSIGTLQELFPNASFPRITPTAFIAARNLKEVVEILPYDNSSQKLTSISPIYQNSDDKVYIIQVNSLTDEEKSDAIKSQWEAIRFERDIKLEECDWRFLSDSSNSTTEWLNYRKSLRDLPANQDDPYNITWPTAPS